MYNLNFDMAQTLALAVVLLVIGGEIKKRVSLLERFFIPAPVIGGVLFSILMLIGHSTGKFGFQFDGILKDFLMIGFFTTIGFSASFELLKKGGIAVFLFLIAAVVLVTLQDILGITLAKFLGLHPLMGLAAGSIPLTGGHGTSGAFGPALEALGAKGATVVAIASATYGLVAGCLIGGPVGKRLISKHNITLPTLKQRANDGECKTRSVTQKSLFNAICFIAISMGLGSFLQPIVIKATGITFPPYICTMVVAVIFRNISDKLKKPLPLDEIEIAGNISLSIFLSMALMTMKLWELAELALPLITILLSQTVLMCLFAYFVTFRLCGKNYDGAVMACGHCGFGLGATPNAMANIETFTAANGYSAKAFFVIPLVGSLFIDFFNGIIITFFMNMF